MIKIKEYMNEFDGVPFYIAEATKLNKKASGNTKRLALNNLKYKIECGFKKKTAS